jgi:hypothetical protein
MPELNGFSDESIRKYLEGPYNLRALTVPQLSNLLVFFKLQATGAKGALVEALEGHLNENREEIMKALAPQEPSAKGIEDCRDYILGISTNLTSQRKAIPQPFRNPKPSRLNISVNKGYELNQPSGMPPQPGIRVDEYCGLSNSHEIYVYNTNGIVFHAMLNGTGSKCNNFYLIQLLMRKASGSSEADYRMWTRWGRVGRKGRGLFLHDRTNPARENKYTYGERKDSSNIVNDGLSCLTQP